MSDINRYSSRRERLDNIFLSKKLKHARSYLRIAGYFRSSIFELVGEEITTIPDVRIVCNSELDALDITVSKAAREVALKELWNQVPIGIDSLLNRECYRKLYELLIKGNIQIRIVPKDKVFLHGKAGVIETNEGKTCFLGSINETKSAYTKNYEILWEDTSSDGVAWVEEEFEALWKDAIPLPDVIVNEIKRVAERIEVPLSEVGITDLPAAALVESPIYRGGEQLQSWQKSFVSIFLEHRETYGQVRLLLADDVGLGKTLSLATSATLSVLLNDGPVLILCPSTLTLQWQAELNDRLGVPSAVWLSSKKIWFDSNGHFIKTQGPYDIARCPYQIAIVSTGLIFHDSRERAVLLERYYGTIVLDEAHKARRRGGLGDIKDQPNNLLDFMLKIGAHTKNILLGTATPIQTEVYELWDLMKILNSNVDFVLGRENVSYWADWEKALPFVKGDKTPVDEKEAWELIRNPLSPGIESSYIATLRQQLGIGDHSFFSNRPFSDLGYFAQENVRQVFDVEFLKNNNPIIRHTVLRQRETLEEQGLLEKIGVNIHPNINIDAFAYLGANFSGLGLMTNHPFDLAYQAAERFAEELKERTKIAGFIKTMLLQRICSSFASGKSTAERMLNREFLDDEEDAEYLAEALTGLTKNEVSYLETIISELSRTEAKDPKLTTIIYFLTRHLVDGKTWLEHGSIIFSQYYDTVFWIAAMLAKTLPNEIIAVYAGLGKSGLFSNNDFNSAEREDIKTAIKRRKIRIVVATDAACEGLNLQTLGTLINVDIPWNPSRLEQRLGRIKRIGQVRRNVDMLNLVYNNTQDEKIYQVLSRRLKDKYDIFGRLPDTIEDEWIENIEKLEEMMDKYIHLREQAKNVFELRNQTSILPNEQKWELCSKVLSRKDILERLSMPW
ncbi:MAG: DEAD/DEAH box helicase [Ruminiclostridium sp.]|nr:DEAD/DEAH box helicase [Ruminiclostridium sp.]